MSNIAPQRIRESATEAFRAIIRDEATPVGVKLMAGEPKFISAGIAIIENALTVEWEKSEKLADEMYLTGVHDAYCWAKNWGHHDFAERILKEVNDRAEHSGLPKLKVPA